MANELTIQADVNYSKGVVKLTNQNTKKIDVSGTAIVNSVFNIGITEEAIALADVAAPGYCLIHNTDATNFVTVGATTGVYTIKLLPLEVALFRLNGTTLFALADTAACDVQFTVFSN